jgi:16S rRNA (cytidine1402-2'-O)-methyltransferase
MSQKANVPYAAAQILSEIEQQTYPVATLYVIATPIGNVADISLRALHVLSIVDAVACEDTRNTGQLLSRYGLSKPLIATHQHNEREAANLLISRLQAGERIALVSDAGTPAVSDPGARIVDGVRAAGLGVVPLPGASAPITALSASGLINDHFYFAGFLPTGAIQRKNALASLHSQSATLVFLEAPHRIVETVKAIADVFEPERQIVISRELTKLFEEIHRCNLSEAEAWLLGNPNRTKGEFVLLVEGAPSKPADNAEAERVLSVLLSELPVSQAASLTARITGQKKNTLYERALEIKNQTAAQNS